MYYDYKYFLLFYYMKVEVDCSECFGSFGSDLFGGGIGLVMGLGN